MGPLSGLLGITFRPVHLQRERQSAVNGEDRAGGLESPSSSLRKGEVPG